MTAIPALGHPSLTAAIRALAGDGLDHAAMADRLNRLPNQVRSLEKQGRAAQPGRRGVFHYDEDRVAVALRGPFREVMVTIARLPAHGLTTRGTIHIPRLTHCHACDQLRRQPTGDHHA